MASLTSSESQSGATVSLPLREPRLPRGLCGCALEWLGRQVGNLPIQGDAVPVRLEQSGEYLRRRAERRRRLAEPDLEFRAFCARRGLPA
jgi:hypothetical protein